MRVVIIGAGLGGLSAAAHLTGSGHEVTIVERESTPGGRANCLTGSGYRIDLGPTVLTMPEQLDATFRAIKCDRADFVTIDPVDPMFRAVFDDGTTLYVRRDRDEMAEEIREVFGGSAADGFSRFASWSAELFELQRSHFANSNYDSPREFLRPWRATISMLRLGAYRRLGKRLEDFFEDEQLRRLFSAPLTYLGAPVASSPAAFAVWSHVSLLSGVYMARGGSHAVARGLERAVREAGVTIRYRHPVTRILRSGSGAVNGVEVGGGERIVADAVVCNADLPVAYRTLLGGVEAPRVARRGTYAPSSLLWTAGVKGLADDGIARHNIHFGGESDDAYRSLYRRGRQRPNPSTLVSVPSIGDPSVAPAGNSTIYALEPVPNLSGRVDWATQRDRLAAELKARVATFGYPTDAVVEAIVDPLDWEAMGLERGTPFALAHTLRQTGPFRPSNIDNRIPGLVFVGSSTRPGVGVPTVLLSGRLAAERVATYGRETAVMKW